MITVDYETVLGQGGFGMVYKGTYNGQIVALKQQDHYDARDEIEVLEKLDHQNIVKLFGSRKDKRVTWMALELCIRSLDSEIKSSVNGLRVFEMVQMIGDVLRGYEYLVRKRVYHGDVKPQNVLLSSNGAYKIADFGLSVLYEEGEQISAISGSYEYAHPVVFELMNWKKLYPKTSRPNNRSWPPTTDLWSLGVMWYQAAVGQRPFAAKSTGTLFEIISQKPINDICGYEESDGQICRYSSFPQHEISPFLDELAVLLTSMLNSDANGLPSFEDFFHQAKDNYGYWRAMNN